MPSSEGMRPSDPSSVDVVAAVLEFLESPNEIVRTAAARALAEWGDERARGALARALLDEDPDVRSDAMTALARLASVEEASAVRESLCGDPVREVKIAAVQALASVGDDDDVALLRALAGSRLEDRVAWEDEGGTWDDWLDVQVAVIEALGERRVVAAIPELLALRGDELGQDLDAPLFAALASMGGDGVRTLLTLARDADDATRRRAVGALARCAPERLTPELDALLADPAASVRRLAAGLLSSSDERLSALCRDDADPSVRRAALETAGAARQDLVREALTDGDEECVATALRLLGRPLDGALAAALAPVALGHLETGGPALACAAAELVPHLQIDDALTPLLSLVDDGARPLEARVAATRAIGALDAPERTAVLIDSLGNGARQVRVVALTGLADRAGAGDPAAMDALVAAIRETLLEPSSAPSVDDDEAASSVEASVRSEAPGEMRLEIDPAGALLETPVDLLDEDPQAVPTSTLAAIQRAGAFERAEPPPMPEASRSPRLAEGTPEESPARRRRRVAVEGQGNIPHDVSLLAMRVAAILPAEAVLEALTETTSTTDRARRRAAFEALARRAASAPLPAEALVRLEPALADPDSAIRGAAAEAIAGSPGACERLRASLEDEDATVRVTALRAVAKDDPDVALRMLADDSPVVRTTAYETIADLDDPARWSVALDRCIAAAKVDTLAHAVASTPRAAQRLGERLGEATSDPRLAFILLDALARGGAERSREASVIAVERT